MNESRKLTGKYNINKNDIQEVVMHNLDPESSGEATDRISWAVPTKGPILIRFHPELLG